MQADDNIDAVAKETLGKAIQSARLEEVGKEFAYGNKAGRGLLGDVHEMKELQFVEHQAQTDRLQAQIDYYRAQIDYRQANIDRLQAQMDRLQAQMGRH